MRLGHGRACYADCTLTIVGRNRSARGPSLFRSLSCARGREGADLSDQVCQSIRNSPSALLADPHNPDSPFLLLKAVEIRIELERKSRVANVFRPVHAREIVGPQLLTRCS